MLIPEVSCNVWNLIPFSVQPDIISLFDYENGANPAVRIGIDARKIEDTGIGRYIENLIDGLLAIDSGHEYTLFMEPSAIDRFEYLADRVQIVPETAGKYSLQEHYSLAKKASDMKLDLFHAPHYVLPFFLKTPSVVTIHDLIHLISPSFSVMEKIYAKFMIRSAISRTSAIITVSNRTKNNLVCLLGANEKKISVIPNAGGADFTRTPEEELPGKLAEYGVEQGYYLFVGSDRPHKNIGAVERVMDIMGSDVRFVIVGRVLEHTQRVFDKFNGRVKFLGSMDKHGLEALYSGAEALLFPSYHEGFGLPPLEAMACRTPVVASNRSSIPEAVGNAAILCDPEDAGEMAMALGKIASDREFRDALVEKGLKRVQLFSWEKMAEMTLDVYERAGS